MHLTVVGKRIFPAIIGLLTIFAALCFSGKLNAQCTPTASGLVSWWRGEGNANDTADGNNGSPIGALGYGSGEVGQAFVLDGSSSYIQVAASPSLNIGTGSGVTIECWIKPAS